MIRINKKLNLYDLPKDIIYILLKKNFKKQLFKNLFKYLNNKQASKFLNVKEGTFSYWKGNGEFFVYRNKRKFSKAYIPLKSLIKISKFLVKMGHKEYSSKNIIKNLKAYRHKKGSSVYNPKFPINFESKEGGILAAAILCDGGINSNGYPIYNNSEDCMRIKMVNVINKLIGKIDTNPLNHAKNNCLTFPKVIKDILVTGLNMQIGDKVTNNPKIPEIFLNTNKKEVIGAFLNQAFSDDGSAYIYGKNKQGAIGYGESTNVTLINNKLRKEIKNKNLYEYGANLVNDCKFLLEKLDIKVNGPYCKKEYIRKKYGKREIIHSWGIQIQGKQNIQKFKDLVSFSIPRKNQKINEILNNYKEIDYRTSFKDSHKRVINLDKNNININVKTFAKERGCSLRNAKYLIYMLQKEGIIKRCGGGQINGIKGNTNYEYKLLKTKLSS